MRRPNLVYHSDDSVQSTINPSDDPREKMLQNYERSDTSVLPDYNDWEKSGMYWRSLAYWFPRAKYILWFNFSVVLGSSLLFVGLFLARPEPLLLVNYPDGALRCVPLYDEQNVLLMRSADHETLCQQLEYHWGQDRYSYEKTTTVTP